MFLRKKHSSGILLFVVLFSLLTASCESNKRLVYFNQQKDTSFNLVSTNFEPLIQKGDLLNIAVNSLDPASSIIFNSQNSLSTVTPTGVGGAPGVMPGSMVQH